MTLQIDTFVLGPFETNTYVLRSGERCWVVDPAIGAQELLDFLVSRQIEPEAILLTHGHGDHIAGICELANRFESLKVLCPEADRHMLTDPEANLSAQFGVPIVVSANCDSINPGDLLSLGDMQWAVLDTSGHTRGGVSFYCAEADTVITGDALFAGSIGRTDFPGGSASRLLGNIRNNLMVLGDQTRVLPGHGPETTIGRQRAENPFLR